MGRRGPQKGAVYTPTKQKAEARAILRAVMMEELRSLITPQLQNARGLAHFFLRDEHGRFVKIEDADKIETALNSGDEGSYYWIFTKDPSVQAFQALWDRAFDRPTEHLELTGEEGGPLSVRWLRDAESDDPTPPDHDPEGSPE